MSHYCVHHTRPADVCTGRSPRWKGGGVTTPLLYRIFHAYAELSPLSDFTDFFAHCGLYEILKERQKKRNQLRSESVSASWRRWKQFIYSAFLLRAEINNVCLEFSKIRHLQISIKKLNKTYVSNSLFTNSNLQVSSDCVRAISNKLPTTPPKQ